MRCCQLVQIALQILEIHVTVITLCNRGPQRYMWRGKMFLRKTDL